MSWPHQRHFLSGSCSWVHEVRRRQYLENAVPAANAGEEESLTEAATNNSSNNGTRTKRPREQLHQGGEEEEDLRQMLSGPGRPKERENPLITARRCNMSKHNKKPSNNNNDNDNNNNNDNDNNGSDPMRKMPGNNRIDSSNSGTRTKRPREQLHQEEEEEEEEGDEAAVASNKDEERKDQNDNSDAANDDDDDSSKNGFPMEDLQPVTLETLPMFAYFETNKDGEIDKTKHPAIKWREKALENLWKVPFKDEPKCGQGCQRHLKFVPKVMLEGPGGPFEAFCLADCECPEVVWACKEDEEDKSVEGAVSPYELDWSGCVASFGPHPTTGECFWERAYFMTQPDQKSFIGAWPIERAREFLTQDQVPSSHNLSYLAPYGKKRCPYHVARNGSMTPYSFLHFPSPDNEIVKSDGSPLPSPCKSRCMLCRWVHDVLYEHVIKFPFENNTATIEQAYFEYEHPQAVRVVDAHEINEIQNYYFETAYLISSDINDNSRGQQLSSAAIETLKDFKELKKPISTGGEEVKYVFPEEIRNNMLLVSFCHRIKTAFKRFDRQCQHDEKLDGKVQAARKRREQIGVAQHRREILLSSECPEGFTYNEEDDSEEDEGSDDTVSRLPQ